MSDTQVLAEFGTGLCIAALAFAGGGGAVAQLVVPAAVLGAWLWDFQSRGEKATVKAAISRAVKALEDCPDLSDDDIRLANSYLQERKSSLAMDPETMARAVRTGEIPAALFNIVTDAGRQLEEGPTRAIQLTLESVYAVCRTRQDYHTVFTQEVIIHLSRGHGIILDDLERIGRQSAESLKNDQIIIEGISAIRDLHYYSPPRSEDIVTALKNERLATARLLDEISDHGISATEVTRFLRLLISLEIDIVKAGEIVKNWKKNG